MTPIISRFAFWLFLETRTKKTNSGILDSLVSHMFVLTNFLCEEHDDDNNKKVEQNFMKILIFC